MRSAQRPATLAPGAGGQLWSARANSRDPASSYHSEVAKPNSGGTASKMDLPLTRQACGSLSQDHWMIQAASLNRPVGPGSRFSTLLRLLLISPPE
jgi:hypothetical protein